MLSAGSQHIHRARAISGISPESASDEKAGAAAGIAGDLLKAAGCDGEESRREFFTLSALALALSVITPALFPSISGFLAAPVGPLAVYIIYRRRAVKRVYDFEKDYPALLVSLASAVRSGLDPIVALTKSAELFEKNSEVSKAIKDFEAKIEKGYSEEDAILSFASDIKHPDIELFRTSFLLARKEGSSLGECLHRLTRVTRQRQSFRRKIKAAIAMQKLSAVGISGCALAIGIIQYASNKKAMEHAMNHPAGQKVLMGGCLLIVLGLIWMLNLSRNKV